MQDNNESKPGNDQAGNVVTASPEAPTPKRTPSITQQPPVVAPDAPVEMVFAPCIGRPESTRMTLDSAPIPVVVPGEPGIPVLVAARIAGNTQSRAGRNSSGAPVTIPQRKVNAEFGYFVVRVVDDVSNRANAMLTDRYQSVQIECFGYGPTRLASAGGLHKPALAPNQRLAVFTAALANAGVRRGGIMLSRAMPRETEDGRLVLNVPVNGSNNPDWNDFGSTESLLVRPLRMGMFFNVEGDLNEKGAEQLAMPELDERDRVFLTWLTTEAGKPTAAVLGHAHLVLVENAARRSQESGQGNIAPDLVAGQVHDLGAAIDLGDLD